MNDQHLRTHIAEELHATEPPLRIDLAKLHQAGRRRQRRSRTLYATITAAVVVIAGSVWIHADHRAEEPEDTIASDHTPSRTTWPWPTRQHVLPGGDRVTAVGHTIVATGTGSRLVNLGPRPPHATNLSLSAVCLTAGTVHYDGYSITCTAQDTATPDTDPMSKNFVLAPLTADQRTVSVTAAPDVRWKVSATYAQATSTPWGTNARGETYGVANDAGTPDLIAVAATNGRQGYAHSEQLQGTESSPTTSAPATPIPVYESDGTTQIGTFTIDNHSTGALNPSTPTSSASDMPHSPFDCPAGTLPQLHQPHLDDALTRTAPTIKGALRLLLPDTDLSAATFRPFDASATAPLWVQLGTHTFVVQATTPGRYYAVQAEVTGCSR